MISLLVLLSVFGLGGLLVLYGTFAKNRWGINLDPTACPRCQKMFPRVRKPNSLQQALWGGSTCEACGIEVDKWGRRVL